MNSSKFVSQGDSDGRQYTIWTGSLRSLRKKVPHFTQEEFKIEKGINKYMDCIVREPLPDLRADMEIHEIMEEVGYPEAATGDRIPIAAVRNSYGLVSHHKMLDDVLAELESLRPDVRNTDLQDLQATMKLSIYGARIYIEFLLPDYRKDPYTLKVTCRNSVGTRGALTINLFLHRSESAEFLKPDIPFYGFHHVHSNALHDDAIRNFMFTAVHRFLYRPWRTDEVDYDDLLIIINKTRNISRKHLITIINRLGPKKKMVNIHRFNKILSELMLEGIDIFKNQEGKLTMLATLTSALRKLTE